MDNALIISFILHLAGDYLFQNDWMATEKTKSNTVAFIHATIYSLPFYILIPSFYWLIVIVSHYFIDRYRLAQYWIRLVNLKWDGDNFGYGDEKPKWMSVWLMIIIDNTWHILFNSLAIFLHYL